MLLLRTSARTYKRMYKTSQANYKTSALIVLLSTTLLSVSVGLAQEKLSNDTPLLSPLVVQAHEPVVVTKTHTKYLTPKTTEQKIAATFGNEADTALKVAKCESSLNPKAVNKTSSARGLFQIMQSWHKIDQKWLLNEDINIAVAYQLWLEQGWTPWEASRHCWGY